MTTKLRRYFWLIDTLGKGEHTLEELSDKWDRSVYNINHISLSRRTFQEHKNAINSLDIGIQINYNPSDHTYFLESDDRKENATANWMWNMMSLQSAISQNTRIKDRIITEENPSAQLYLQKILDAIRGNNVIDFSYQRFGGEEFCVICYPYFVQFTNQRWYVFGIREGEDKMKAYALDRMKSIVVKKETFKFPEEFNAEEYLSEHGVGEYENIPIMDVVIRAYGKQVDYLRTQPLHPSQKETKTEEGKSEFTYKLRPTTKFFGDILSKGKYVKVLSPGYVRKKMRETVEQLALYYKL